MPQPSASPGPVPSLRCTLDYARLDDFVARYSRNVSRAGVFLPMREPLEVGSTVRFEVMLAEGQVALRGEGTVSFRAPYEPGASDRLHGIGLRFSRLDDHSREMIERVMAYKATHQAEFFEAARDPILTPTTPFAFVSPTVVASAHVAPATVAQAPVAPATVASAHVAPAPVAQATVAPTTASLSAPSATSAPGSAAAAPVPSTAPVVSGVAASPTAVPKSAAAGPAEPAIAHRAPTPVASEPTVAAKPAAASTPEASAPAKATGDGSLGSSEPKPSPHAASPATPPKETPASQKTPIRTVTIPRASLAARPSAQTPLVAMSLQNSAKTPVPTGEPDVPRPTTKPRSSDSAQTPKVELPVPAAAGEPRRPDTDSARTPRHSATTPVVRSEASIKEAARSAATPSPPTSSSSSVGRGPGRSSPDERSRHDADEELAALRTPASSRSAPSPDASKRLQELLGRRPSSGQKD